MQGFRRGIKSGEAAVREVAAYVINCFHNKIFDVPPTAYVEFKHPFFKNKSDIEF